jgi:hypothetical protein
MIPTSNAGVSYYRLWSWAIAAHRNRTMHVMCPWFQYGLTETNPWEVDITDPMHHARILNEINSHAQRADVIVMQMAHTPAALNLFMSLKEAYPHIPVVSEIDDNMLSTAEYNPAAACYGPGSMFRQVAVEQFSNSDAMIVSTPYLREVYRDFCENIHVVPNSLDFKVWGNIKKKSHGGIRIGWAGGASHAEDLRLVENVIPRICAKHRGVKFVFVHGAPDFIKTLPGVDFVQKFSRVDKYPGFLASRGFDIGIAPLVDNAFNRGKSNLRWLEYAGLGIPCVASNVGHFKETLRHGEDVLFADDEDGFVNGLSTLIEDRKARLAIGARARDRARRDFNIDVNVFEFERILRGVMDKGQVKRIVQNEYDSPIIPIDAERAISSPEVYS